MQEEPNVTRRRLSSFLGPYFRVHPGSLPPYQPGDVTQLYLPPPMPPPPPSYYLRVYSYLDQTGSLMRARVVREQPQSREQRLASFDINHLPMLSHLVFNYDHWAPYPPDLADDNLHPGLAHLLSTDSLSVNHSIDLTDFVNGIEIENLYTISNKEGKALYYALESSMLCPRYCCTACRHVRYHIRDVYHNEIIRLNKPWGCSHSCFFCCLMRVEVFAPPPVKIGVVHGKWHLTRYNFAIGDADNQKRYFIRGPRCSKYSLNCFGCFTDRFTIHASNMSGPVIGVIEKRYSDLFRDVVSESDLYTVRFPLDLDVNMKVTFLGAVFLILCSLEK